MRSTGLTTMADFLFFILKDKVIRKLLILCYVAQDESSNIFHIAFHDINLSVASFYTFLPR